MNGSSSPRMGPAWRATMVAIMSMALLAGVGMAVPGSLLAADAPAAATKPGAAIEAGPRFAIRGSIGGSDVEMSVDALGPGIWPDHPSVTGLALSTDGPADIGIVDGCSSNGHFWFFVDGPLGDYDLSLLDTANGTTKRYTSSTAPLEDPDALPVAFLDPTALATCMPESKVRTPPRRISGRANQEQVAGAETCGVGFKNKFVIKASKKTTYTRDFGRGLKSDLRLRESDADSKSAVFGDGGERFDATMILWLEGNVLSGLLAEGPNGTFPEPGSRSLVGPRPQGDDWDMLIDTFASPPGACVWTSEQRLDKKSRRAVEAFWERVTGPTSGPVPPPDDERFDVEVEWSAPDGPSMAASIAPALRADDGLFYFLDPGDWEVLVKVLDGCGFSDHFWVFAATTTNVEYTLTVTDTLTSDMRTYSNELGDASPAVVDTSAFATCP